MPIELSALPTLAEQAELLIELGLAASAGLTPQLLRAAAAGFTEPGLLVVRAELLPPSVLAPRLRLTGRPGFVVTDMTDVDEFEPVAEVQLPTTPVYLLRDPDRGDALANWSPTEALPAITAAGRTPLTLAEGLHWVLQQPDVLHRRHCFMTIGSRRRKPNGSLDARTPALWISNGTGRDGAQRRDAPKVGWCWAGNRHTWLGFASAAARQPAT